MELYDQQVDDKIVLSYFEGRGVLDHYEEATRRIGLWASEELVFRKCFQDQKTEILELGCGVGRISFSLWMLGYGNLTASDVSNKMVRRALNIQKERSSEINFLQSDATQLSFDNNSFDGVIFGFNGLMQIPHRANRKKAMQECFRVLRPNGKFVFTSHDRSLPKWKKFWENERKKWKIGSQDKALLEFGDRYGDTANGKLFIHVPDTSDIRKDLKEAGFLLERDVLRSRVAEESQMVKDFSDECRFWIARKPEPKS
jgi:ubiquinone/menaquinone biosynthesis C-methylase UbiE